MPTVAERLRRMRRRGTAPDWIPDHAVDGAGVLRVFLALTPLERCERAGDLIPLRLRSAGAALLDSLRSGPSWVEPAKALRELGGPENGPALVELVGSGGDPGRRALAAHALMGPAGRNRCVVPGLARVASDVREPASVRGHALEALAYLGPRRDGRIVQAVLRSLDDASPEVVHDAVFAAGALRVSVARPRLLRMAAEDLREAYGSSLSAVALDALDSL